jgi:transcriptional regulator with XRE-family HTH domain
MLGKRLRQLREARGMTQAELATAVKVTQAYIAYLEGGGRKNPSLDLLRRLAKLLKTDMNDLIG